MNDVELRETRNEEGQEGQHALVREVPCETGENLFAFCGGEEGDEGVWVAAR